MHEKSKICTSPAHIKIAKSALIQDFLVVLYPKPLVSIGILITLLQVKTNHPAIYGFKTNRKKQLKIENAVEHFITFIMASYILHLHCHELLWVGSCKVHTNKIVIMCVTLLP